MAPYTGQVAEETMKPTYGAHVTADFKCNHDVSTDMSISCTLNRARAFSVFDD